eukprot:gene1349-biopygen1081
MSTSPEGDRTMTSSSGESFFKKGKQAFWKAMLLEAEFIRLFSVLGSSSQVSDDLANGLEKFVCVLYGNKRISSVNLLRHKLFVQMFEREKKIIDLSLLPSCKENLRLHILRASYVAMIFRQANGLMLQLDAQVDHGWNESGSVRWSDTCYPEDISELSMSQVEVNESRR